MELLQFFEETKTDTETHQWSLIKSIENQNPEEKLCLVLSKLIMRHHLRGIPQHYEIWCDCFENEKPLPEETKRIIREYIRPVFRLPDSEEEIPPDHLEGLIAEYLWYFISLESSTSEIVFIDPPKFKATDHGGDGIIFHRKQDGDLMYRLWETKKYSGQSEDGNPVNETIKRAYKQLRERATEYLARYSVIGQENKNIELAKFCSHLVEMWLDASADASAGVSISTSKPNIPIDSFSNFPEFFPEFLDPKRLLGMLTAFNDFQNFSIEVRDLLWTGL